MNGKHEKWRVLCFILRCERPPRHGLAWGAYVDRQIRDAESCVVGGACVDYLFFVCVRTKKDTPTPQKKVSA